MFCNNCGNELKEGHQFCTECGHSNSFTTAKRAAKNQAIIKDDKWWHRLLKVLYIFIYLQILWIVPVVWSENSSRYAGYRGGQSIYEDTYGEAFWYSILAIIIFVTIIKLIKVTVLYIMLAQKPQWKIEFKKLF